MNSTWRTAVILLILQFFPDVTSNQFGGLGGFGGSSNFEHGSSSRGHQPIRIPVVHRPLAMSELPNYRVLQASVQEAETFSNHCRAENIPVCIEYHSGHAMYVDRDRRSDSFGFHAIWAYERRQHRDRVPQVSPWYVRRAYPIRVRDIILGAGDFVMSWDSSSVNAGVQIHVEIDIIRLQGLWARRYGTELVALAINWTLVCTDDPDRPLVAASNDQYTDPRDPLSRTEYGLWSWQDAAQVSPGHHDLQNYQFQRTLRYVRPVLTAAVPGAPYDSAKSRKMVFVYTVAALHRLIRPQ